MTRTTCLAFLAAFISLPLFAETAAHRPQIVVLKMDDLTANGANREKGEAVSWRLRNFVETVRRLDVKASLGLIGNSLEGDNPAYVAWVKALHNEGRIEIWNHGYSHKEFPAENGKRRAEFYGVSLEDQRENFAKTQRLAKAKLGFELKAFGSPFNLSDETTEKMLEEFPDVTVWFFGPAKPKHSTKLILERRINLENPTMSPNSAKLIEDYTRYGHTLPYIVLQGHPNGWNDEKLAEFEKTVTFLKEKGCVFMTPSEFYAKVTAVDNTKTATR